MRAVNPWLMTDERIAPEALLAAARQLPPGSGVVFRHRATPPADRLALYRRLRRIARARRLTITTVGPLPGSDGEHGGRRPLTAPAHDRRQAIVAGRRGARYLFVSPIYPTRSHRGAPTLGPMKAAMIASSPKVFAVALGGMDARRFRHVRRLGFDGWAAIDALVPAQKRKAVPR